MIKAERYADLNYWQQTLGLSAWKITLERISSWQVTDVEAGRANISTIGIRIDDEETRKAALIHTRKLKPEDIVHELLHIVHPKWTHEQVVAKTQTLIQLNRKPAASTI